MQQRHAHSYGIRVISDVEISDFFTLLNAKLPDAEKVALESLKIVKNVLFKNHLYTPSYLATDVSFQTIIPSIAAIGVSIDNERVVTVLGDIISKKTELTRQNNAWDQYEHLAGWLAYLASILEIEGAALEGIFLNSTLRSMTTMSKHHSKGYSWHAYSAWNNRWNRITASNRSLIRKHIEENTSHPDALELVRRS